MTNQNTLSNMKVFILDVDKEKTDRAAERFCDTPNVQIVNQGFEEFMSDNEVECVVSAGTNRGDMDGDYDRAIVSWFGEQLMDRVNEHIQDNFYGEQPVGTSFIIDTGKKEQKLIHTPIVISRRKIMDDYAAVVYHCMRSALMCAMENDIESIVFPILASWKNGVEPELAVEWMYHAYLQLPGASREPSRVATRARVLSQASSMGR